MKIEKFITLSLYGLVATFIANWFFPMGTNRTLPQILSLSTLIILFIAVAKFKVELNYYTKSLLYWIILITIHAFILNKSTNLGTSLTYIKIVYWAFWGLLFYTVGKHNLINNEKFYLIIKIFASILLIRTLFLLTNFDISTAPQEIRRELLNFNSYILLWICPFFFRKYITEHKDKLFVLAIILAIIFSIKRGPMLAILFAFTVTYSFMYRKNLFRFVKFFVFFSIFITLIYILLENYYPLVITKWTASDLSVEGLSSGRTAFWQVLLDVWANSSSWTKLFGFGFFTTGEYIEKYYGIKIVFAHNDWIQSIFDYGLVGGYLFLAIHLGMLKGIFLAFRYSLKDQGYALLFAYCLFFISNFYTMATMNPYTAWFFIFFGYYLGHLNREITLLKKISL